jgi:hypothetical protein
METQGKTSAARLRRRSAKSAPHRPCDDVENLLERPPCAEISGATKTAYASTWL